MGQNVNDIITEVFTLIEILLQKSDHIAFKIASCIVQTDQYYEPVFWNPRAIGQHRQSFEFSILGSWFFFMEIIILPCQHTCDKDPLPKGHSRKDLDILKDAGEIRGGLVRTQQWRDTYVEMIVSSDFTEQKKTTFPFSTLKSKIIQNIWLLTLKWSTLLEKKNWAMNFSLYLKVVVQFYGRWFLLQYLCSLV